MENCGSEDYTFGEGGLPRLEDFDRENGMEYLGCFG